MLLFQQFEFEVVVRPGKLNVETDHLSRIDTGEEPIGVEEDLPDAHLFWIEVVLAELEEIVQFLENGQAPEGMNTNKKKISYESLPIHLNQWIPIQNGFRWSTPSMCVRTWTRKHYAWSTL